MNPIQETFYIRVEGKLAEDAVDPKNLGITSVVFDHFYEGGPAADAYYEVAFSNRHQAEAYQNYLTSLTFTTKEKLKVLEDIISDYFEIDDQYLACKHRDGVIPLSELAPQRAQYIKSILRAKP